MKEAKNSTDRLKTKEKKPAPTEKEMLDKLVADVGRIADALEIANRIAQYAVDHEMSSSGLPIELKL